MSRLKQNLQRNNFTIFILLINLINTADVTTASAINGVSEPLFLSSNQQTQRSPNQLLTEYELGDEVKKCSRVRNDSGKYLKKDIFE